MMRWRDVYSAAAIGLAAALALAPGNALAQSSANFQVEQATFNAGGHPADGVVMASASHTISLDSIGEGAVAGGMTSASFRMDAGLVGLYQPPLEVAPSCGTGAGTCLAVSHAASPSIAQLTWPFEPSGGSYNLYRETVPSLAGLAFGACYQQGLTTELAVDADPISVESGFFYLVTAVNRLGEQGTKGFLSNGAERAGAVCP
jgi:hypothetical protein